MTFLSADRPAVAVRGIHLDLKGVPPTFERLLGLLPVIKAGGYNALLVEWEDMFPWTVDARFRCETAYTPDQVRSFAEESARLGLEIIPLVQCLGHMETPLSVADYRTLREIPYLANCLNPLAPGARELVERMVDDVLALLPEVRRFHLGGDEAWSFGKHPDTKAYIEKHGKHDLYLRHVEPLLDRLNGRGVRPILWSDMMHDWPAEGLRAIGRKTDLCPWGYGGHPDNFKYHSNSTTIARFSENGITLWGAAAYKGADGHSSDLVDVPKRQENALGWVDVARRYGLVGVFATAWSRYSTDRMQCEPIDGALDALLLVGACLHDGRAPEGGAEACLQELARLGERARFDECRTALEELKSARYWGWGEVQRLREQVTLETLDPRRREAGMACEYLRDLRRHLGVGATGAVARARRAFAGCMAPIWIERYLADRLEPLWEELGSLDARVRTLEPEAYGVMFGAPGPAPRT